MLDLGTFVGGGFVLPGKEIGRKRDYGDAMVQGVRGNTFSSSVRSSIITSFHLGTEFVDVWTLATCRKHPMQALRTAMEEVWLHRKVPFHIVALQCISSFTSRSI